MPGMEEVQAEITTLTTEIRDFRKNSVALSAWEEFKTDNDKRVSTLERKSAVDPLLEEKLNKIAADVAKEQERYDQFSATLQRLNMQIAQEAESNDVSKHALTLLQIKTSRSNPSTLVRPDQVNVQDYLDYKSAWNRWARKGDHMLTPDEMKAMSVGSDPDGGYLVNPEQSARIVTRVFETSPMRQLATVETIGTMSLEGLVDKDDITDGWVSETGTRSQATTPQWAKYQIAAHEQYAMPAATQTLLDDASLDIESWLSRKLSDRFARTEATAFLTGTGVGKPRGILNPASGTSWGQIEQIATGHATLVTADGLISLAFSLKEPYYANANFLMNRASIASVMKLKTGTGEYLWNMNLQQGQPSTLLGYPVRFANDMPAIGAGTLPIAFGDFRAGYTIVDRIGTRVLRDPFTVKPYILFYTTRRVGADVVDYDAYKLQVVSA